MLGDLDTNCAGGNDCGSGLCVATYGDTSVTEVEYNLYDDTMTPSTWGWYGVYSDYFDSIC